FAHRHGQLADAVAGGSRLGAVQGFAKKRGPFVGIVTELVAKNAERAGGIAETAGDIIGEFLVDEEGAEGLVLALEGELG
ncbi:MAG TPA: hypothetical protein VF860_13540, partial [Candidatus Acidoferrales bacterium]